MAGLNNFKERAIGDAPASPVYGGPDTLLQSSLCCQLPAHSTEMTHLFAEYVKQAVAEDQAGNWQPALDHYKQSLECFILAIKYEKNPRSKDAITSKAIP